jgi:SAM-dependent methyltransferase
VLCSPRRAAIEKNFLKASNQDIKTLFMNSAQKLGLVARVTQLSRSCRQKIAALIFRCYGRVAATRGKGFSAYRNSSIDRLVNDEEFLRLLQQARPLPTGTGAQLDERVIEYPWVFSKLLSYGEEARFLDAGSALNHSFIMNHPLVKRHKWTLLTLAPELECFANLGVSYVYDDLRATPFKADCFDAVFCVSVIEHVGMDNTGYTPDKSYQQIRPRDFLSAIDEMKRVLKPSGWLFLTLPFGRYENHGWFQQFDSALLLDLISQFRPRKEERVFFRSSPQGWQQCSEEDCKSLGYWFAPKADSSSNEKCGQPALQVSAMGLACIALRK